MMRELATQALDLPHTFAAGVAASTCRCGRDLGHALHKPANVEKAAANKPRLVTEKGI